MANTVGKISGQMLESNLLRRDMQTGDENLAFETDLIYLDVFNNRVGINTDTPFRPLVVNSTINITNLIVDNQSSIADFLISSNIISNPTGNILLDSTGPGSQIQAPELRTGSFKLDGSTITNLISNQDIDLNSSGVGKVNFNNDVRINGNLHATGNIVADGNLTFGDDDTDNVIFNAEIGSDIVPNLTNIYNLGNSTKRFSDVYTYLVNGSSLSTGGAIVGGVDLSTRPGNTWYVSAVNGNNSNVGDHPNGPFATIEWALSQATSGDTVFIYPGTYIELFPLVVPSGVTVKGSGIRSTKILPDTASTHEDVFKLNGQTTVEDLTVADFYYDSLNDKGYAFSFASGLNVTSRSPYIRNISVITKGSVTSLADPLGFNQSDAGRGAKVDGSLANASSKEASMLFHSVTFITPGVDSIVMKNGVRVEWLNSFIYYANRGLYAENGSSGFAGLGLKYGAEIRAIGSANVYGNYGAWADGDETLMYLISHNFGYIGSGLDASNDPTNVIQANETYRVNNGKIYYQSMDHKGDFRVGDIFRVESSTGNIEFQTAAITNTSINITDGVSTTYIDATEVDVGNIKISGNTIESVVGAINLVSNNNILNVNQNISISNSLTINNDLNSYNNSFIGNSILDTLTLPSTISSLIPSNTQYSLGSNFQGWRNLYAAATLFDDIVIDTNVITTTQSNSNLELRANGAGNVVIDSDLSVTENLTVDGNTVFSQNLNIANNGYFETFTASGNFEAGEFYNGDILINDNFIKTTLSNSNLELAANNLGIVIFDDNVLVSNDLTVLGNTLLQNVNINNTVSTNNLIINQNLNDQQFYNGNILIDDNFIATTISNANLELRANGTGSVIVNDSLSIQNNFTTFGSSNLQNLSINGNLISNNLITTTGTLNSFSNGDILFDTNVITTTLSNSDLELRADGTGGIIFNQILNFKDSNITNILTAGTESQRSIQFNTYSGQNFVINSSSAVTIPVGNNLTRPVLQSNELRYNSSLASFEVRVVGGNKSLYSVYDIDRNTYITPELTPGANDNIIRMFVNGSVQAIFTQTEATFNKLTVDEISINDNVISTNNSNADIELLLSGTGVGNIKDNFYIGNNSIVNATSNQPTQLQSTGGGYYAFTGTKALRIPSGTTVERLASPPIGASRFNTTDNQLELWDGTVWDSAAGSAGGVTASDMEEIVNILTLVLA